MFSPDSFSTLILGIYVNIMHIGSGEALGIYQYDLIDYPPPQISISMHNAYIYELKRKSPFTFLMSL